MICTSVSQVGDPWDFTFYPIFKLSTEAKLKPDIGLDVETWVVVTVKIEQAVQSVLIMGGTLSQIRIIQFSRGRVY